MYWSKYCYSESPRIRTYNFEMSLFAFSCEEEEVVPIIRVQVLNTVSNTNVRNKDS